MKSSLYILPGFILLVFITALTRRIKAYDSFLTGVKSGLITALELFPTMFGMYISINMLDSSGFLDQVLAMFGNLKEFIAQAIFRPFSSQASLGMMLEIYNRYGVDSPLGITSSILQGSSDSTIYVMSLYLGSYGIIKNKRCFMMGFIISTLSFLVSLFIYLFLYKL